MISACRRVKWIGIRLKRIGNKALPAGISSFQMAREAPETHPRHRQVLLGEGLDVKAPVSRVRPSSYPGGYDWGHGGCLARLEIRLADVGDHSPSKRLTRRALQLIANSGLRP